MHHGCLISILSRVRFPGPQPWGTSDNGSTLGLQPRSRSSILRFSTKVYGAEETHGIQPVIAACGPEFRVQLPAAPPSSPVSQTRSMRWSEKPVIAVQLRAPAPSHGGYRLAAGRKAVNLSGSVRIRVSAPSSGVRLMAGPLTLNQDADVRFVHSRPLATSSIGRTLGSELRGRGS